MASRKTASKVGLKASDLTDMVCELDDVALGAAMRLVEVQLRREGEGLSVDEDLKRFLRLRSDIFRRVEPQLRRVLDTSSGEWRHPGIAKRFEQEKRQRTKARGRKDRESNTPGSGTAIDQAKTPARVPAVNRNVVSANHDVPASTTCPADDLEASQERETAPTIQRQASTSDAQPAATQDARTQTGAPRASTPKTDDKQKSKGGVTGKTEDLVRPARRRGTQGSLLAPTQPRAITIDPSPSARAPSAPTPPDPGHAGNDGSAPSGAGRGTSLLAMAYEVGQRVLVDTGQTPDRARRSIALLLKEYETGYVVEVIDKVVERQGRIAHPYSYMKKLLSEYPKKHDASPSHGRSDRSHSNGPTGEARPISSPDTMGLSDRLVRRIRENAKRAPHYDFVDPDHSDT